MDHLTVTKVAEILHLSTATVKRYIYDGRIASVKLPGDSIAFRDQRSIGCSPRSCCLEQDRSSRARI